MRVTMGQVRNYELSLTTQGPTYPPSEVMDEDGNFIVIGRVNRAGSDGRTRSEWGAAIVAADSPVPPFGENHPYTIVKELPLNPDELSAEDRARELHTLPLPLPCANYPMVFAPEQCPDADLVRRPSYPFHAVPIPDLRPEDGPKVTTPITLGQWVRARGQLEVSVTDDERAAQFFFEFSDLIPNSVYTIMSLREHDLDPAGPTRPGPLGVPNVFVTDEAGNSTYRAVMPNPFPAPGTPGANRIINIVVLWMSYQQSYGGAIGWFGLGGDIHAQLKLPAASFQEFITVP
ncbi:hypothetical protein [Streptomyces sp. NBC_01244]|uniref:hypothetical protein n=1 Tax=Streptomyces sp. NBC_01244 TaxID=2903797 RepID=UPI002E1228DB|nr:hypothetical protein OG247_21580 [Streptomyces sp. NBC_01244]